MSVRIEQERDVEERQERQTLSSDEMIAEASKMIRQLEDLRTRLGWFGCFESQQKAEEVLEALKRESDDKQSGCR